VWGVTEATASSDLERRYWKENADVPPGEQRSDRPPVGPPSYLFHFLLQIANSSVPLASHHLSRPPRRALPLLVFPVLHPPPGAPPPPCAAGPQPPPCATAPYHLCAPPATHLLLTPSTPQQLRAPPESQHLYGTIVRPLC
jgi:hypothetical protein